MPSGGQTQTTVQNKDPWGPAQPFLKDIMQNASNLYNSNAGAQTWQGPLVAPQSFATQTGFNAIADTAHALQPTSMQAYNYGLGQIQNNGLTSAYNAPLSTYGKVASGANGITTGNDFRDVATGAALPTAATTYLTGLANGSETNNPYLKSMLDANDARIANRVNSTISGMGRYGSGGHTNVLASSLAESDNPILATAYDNNLNRQLAAAQTIDAANRAADATRISAIGGQTGVQSQNIGNQLAGAGGQAGILNFGQGNAANWAGLLPNLTQQAYAPGQTLLGLGNYQDAYNQQNIDAQRALFDQQQQMPWSQLSKYLGAVSGLSPIVGQAGTTTGTATTQQQTPWTTYAGLGLAGLGFLSDADEKTDKKKIGTDENTGLDIYSYRYKGDPKTYSKMVGPMAQDIEKMYPGATERIAGKLYVKREAAGLLGML